MELNKLNFTAYQNTIDYSSFQKISDVSDNIFNQNNISNSDKIDFIQTYDGLPQTAQKAIEKIDLLNMPDGINSVLLNVSKIFEFAKRETQNSKTQEREKFDGEKTNYFQAASINIEGKETYIVHGNQVFPDGVINEYVETYLGKNDEGIQNGGWGVLKYPDGTVEIHFDNFENGAPCNGYGVVIDDDAVVYYEADYKSKTPSVNEKIFFHNGEELKQD